MTDILTGASGVLQVAHTGPDGRLHGHSYEIVGWWDGEPCALEMQRRLNGWIATIDHQELPKGMGRAEDIARSAMAHLGCAMVEVHRPLERLFCRLTKDK